jgi:hypothetical protein
MSLTRSQSNQLKNKNTDDGVDADDGNDDKIADGEPKMDPILLQFLESKFNNLKKHFDQKIGEVQQSQQFLSDFFESIKVDFKGVLDENRILKEQVNAIRLQISTDAKKINKLEAELDHLQQEKYNTGLLIFGVPKTTGGSATTFFKKAGEIQSSVTADNITSICLLEKKENKNNGSRSNTSNNIQSYKPPLLIKFKTINAKNEFIKKKKEYKQLFASQIGFDMEEDHQIYIREQLTPFKRDLFHKIRSLKCHLNAEFIWLNGSRILIKKKSKIESL